MTVETDSVPAGPASGAAGPRTAAAMAAVAAALVTLAATWTATGNGFVEHWDDGPYVLQNPAVRAGLSAEGIGWAATAVHVHNWHPLTWISHMADVSAFGVDPFGHHLTSVLLHATSAGLLALLLAALGAPAVAAGLGAMLFGLHPLRVESVAWVAERKDVLSGALALATLLAWVGWRRRGGAGRYALALLLFALALLAKPMVVTLPGVLWLLDLWPLRRASPWRREALALAPFAALSAAVSAATFAAQAGTGSLLAGDDLGAGVRVANAALSIVTYVGRTAWPAGLAAFHPHPRLGLDAPAAWLAIAGVVAVTAACLASARRAPWLAVGWLWFLGMLVPVLGLVQAGRQGWAERYTYLPGIGLLVMLLFSVLALVRRSGRPAAGRAAVAAGVAACIVLAAATREQIATWRDSETLFLHAVAVTGANSVASNALGAIAGRRGDAVGAERHLRAAIAADPGNANPRQNLAAILLSRGDVRGALREAQAAVRLDPTNAVSQVIVGIGLEEEGRLPEAAAAYEAALRLRPGMAQAAARLASVRAALGALAPPGGPP